ncbi:MAG: tetratricopeptide repeat protein [Pyrinomonadaceae bacterium]
MAQAKKSFWRQNPELIVLTGLCFLVIFIYAQTVGFGFINLDDNLYVYENPFVFSGLNQTTFNWAFTHFHSANWHPLTWLSHQLDSTIYGLNPGGHHATNVIFHLVNSILAFLVFSKYTKCFWKSAIVAALFAVHPMHVESVAWISERKDVLSTMFWFLTMWAYYFYVQDGKNTNYYLLAILFFVCGLMAKPMLVTLPFVLILMDFGFLEKLKNLKDLKNSVVEKLPFFALSVISSYVTILAQKSESAIQNLDQLPFQIRFLNTLTAYAKYVFALFYPLNLSVWYPFNENFPVWQVVVSICLLAVITLICVREINKRKYYLTGWLWFLGTLVPVIGLVQVGSQSLADRYTYIPYFGLFIMVVWGFADVFKFFNIKNGKSFAFALFIIIVFSFLAYRQTSFWKNNETLYSHSLSVTDGNYLLAQNYCHYLMLKNDLNQAEILCQQAIEIKTDHAEAINTLGIIYFKRGQFEKAAESFRKTLEIKPGYNDIYFNYSNALSLSGKPFEAEEQLKKAIRFTPPKANPPLWIESLNNLAFSYGNIKKYENAAENYERILQFAPDRADIRANYALMLYKLKKLDDAQLQIENSINQNPNQAESYNNYGLILLEKNEKRKAAEQFEKAINIKPDFKQAAENLKRITGEK